MKAPHPPNNLPKYLAEGLPKQSRETLIEIRGYVDTLIEYKTQVENQPIDERDLPDDAEIIDETDSRGTVLREYRTCGDKSCRCMNGGEKHGPYKYRVYRDGETVRKEYLGKATP